MRPPRRPLHPPAPTVSDSATVGAANRALKAHPRDIVSASGEAYTAYSSKVDRTGAAHVRYTRTYRGLRVYGGDFIVHAKADGTSVGLVRPLTVDTPAKVSAARARTAARARFTGKVASVGAPELFLDATVHQLSS